MSTLKEENDGPSTTSEDDDEQNESNDDSANDSYSNGQQQPCNDRPSTINKNISNTQFTIPDATTQSCRVGSGGVN